MIIDGADRTKVIGNQFTQVRKWAIEITRSAGAQSVASIIIGNHFEDAVVYVGATIGYIRNNYGMQIIDGNVFKGSDASYIANGIDIRNTANGLGIYGTNIQTSTPANYYTTGAGIDLIRPIVVLGTGIYDGFENRNYAAIGNSVFKTTVTGDTVARFEFRADGRLHWGSGAAGYDVELWRKVAGQLGTNDQIDAQDGLVTKTNAGALDDGDFNVDSNGLLAIDSTNGRIYFRYLGAWHYVDQTAGFQINADNAYDALIGPEAKFEKGDIVIGVIDGFMEDGAPHAEYTTLKTALERLGIK